MHINLPLHSSQFHRRKVSFHSGNSTHPFPWGRNRISPLFSLLPTCFIQVCILCLCEQCFFLPPSPHPQMNPFFFLRQWIKLGQTRQEASSTALKGAPSFFKCVYENVMRQNNENITRCCVNATKHQAIKEVNTISSSTHIVFFFKQ